MHDPYRVIGVVRMWNGAARGGTLMQLFPPTLCVFVDVLQPPRLLEPLNGGFLDGRTTSKQVVKPPETGGKPR